MPIYEYRCSNCGNTFEIFWRMQDGDRQLRCPDCESEEVERLLSAFATSGGGAGCAPGSRFT